MFSKNINDCKQFIDYFNHYVKNLKYPDGTLLLNSNRKTGFLGFLICFDSLINLYQTFVESNCLKFIPCYKMSQDHLELFYI